MLFESERVEDAEAIACRPRQILHEISDERRKSLRRDYQNTGETEHGDVLGRKTLFASLVPKNAF